MKKDLYKNRNVNLILLFNFFSDFRIYSAFAVVYFVSVTGSIGLGLLIFSIMTLSSAIGEIPTGIISDILGRKKTMIVGTLFSIISIIFYSIGTIFLLLSIGSIFAGISLSFYSGNNEAYLYDVLANDNKKDLFKDYIGKFGSMFEIGMIFAALFGIVISLWSLKMTFVFSIIPQIICLIISFIIEDVNIIDKTSNNPLKHFKETYNELKKDKKTMKIMTTSSLDFAATGSVYEMAFVYVDTLWPSWSLGIYKIMASGFGAIGYWISGKIIKKYRYSKTIILSNVTKVIFGAIGFFTKTFISPVFTALTSFNFGVGQSALSDIKQRRYSDKYRSTMGSVDSLIKRLLGSILTVAIGFVADNTSIVVAFVVAQLVILIMTVIYPKLLKKN